MQIVEHITASSDELHRMLLRL